MLRRLALVAVLAMVWAGDVSAQAGADARLRDSCQQTLVSLVEHALRRASAARARR